MNIRKIKSEDSTQLFNWVNKTDSLSVKVENQKKINFSAHSKWFSERMNDPNTSIWIIENKKTKHIARKAYLTDFIQYLINNGLKIEEIPINGNWIEIDNHNDVNAAKKSGRLSRIERDVNRIMNKNNL